MRPAWRVALVVLSSCDEGSRTGPREAEDALDPGLCPWEYVYRDRDGDGYGATDSEPQVLVQCAPDASMPGFVEARGDCDDDDARAFRWSCVDRDGDGLEARTCVGAEEQPGEGPCPVVLEWTPSPGPYDCDDADPSLLDFAYRDQDGDGIGAGEAVCAPAGSAYSPYAGDCDDADAARSTLAIEIFGDGVDNDCDGSDGSKCVPASAGTFEFTRGANEVCAGTNVTLGAVSCSSCFVQQNTFAVRNRGAERLQGEVRLVAREGDVPGLPRTFAIDLEPMQEQTLVTVGASGEFELQLVTGTDCDPEDNTFYASDGHCI